MVMLWLEVLLAYIMCVMKACSGDYVVRRGALCGLGVDICCLGYQ